MSHNEKDCIFCKTDKIIAEPPNKNSMTFPDDVKTVTMGLSAYRKVDRLTEMVGDIAKSGKELEAEQLDVLATDVYIGFLEHSASKLEKENENGRKEL